jgi:hypothetical protein
MYTKYSTDRLPLERSVTGVETRNESTHVETFLTLEGIYLCKKPVAMVSIPVFDGGAKADPEKFLKQFKRACMANGDKDPAS